MQKPTISQRVGPSALHQAPGSYHDSSPAPLVGTQHCLKPIVIPQRSPAVLKYLSLNTPIPVGVTQAHTIPQVQHLPITQYTHLGMCLYGIVVPQGMVIHPQVYLGLIQLTHLTLMTHNHLMPSPR